MKQTQLFCHKENGIYMHFYPSIIQVEMCGAKEKDIIKVNVREVINNEQPTHFGWWDNKDNMFCMIYSSIEGVKMCFPYGYKIEEENGKGCVCGLVIEETN